MNILATAAGKRAWLFLDGISALLVMGGFFYVYWRAGWSPRGRNREGR